MKRLIAPPPADSLDQVIDAALHHVAQQDVLRQLLRGKPWARVFGLGGSSLPCAWQGHAQGITVQPRGMEPSLIPIQRIKARAKRYRDRAFATPTLFDLFLEGK